MISRASFGDFTNFEGSSFFILWMIGYEIVATISLVAILISYLKYDDE